MSAPEITSNRPVPVSVWATAQASPVAQRGPRYTRESSAHPAKMLPHIAAEAIARYSNPGDVVMDPMCGIGTTLVEAVHAGRRALGVEYEDRWAAIARDNLALATDTGNDRDALVYTGDGRKLATVLPEQVRGTVDLILTSPPYGDSVHGHVRVRAGEGIRKRNHRYGNTLDRGNLANLGVPRLLSGFTRILTAATAYLKPGGHVVITARPWRQHAELVDLPSLLTRCAATAGLTPVDRAVALLGRLTDNDIVAHSSFFQRDFVLKNRDAGLPLALIAHEDVLVFELKARSRNALEARRFQSHSMPEVAPSQWTGQAGGLAA
ncbi:site-specific DNA-methyltransferase [Nocardia sp. CA2R105]|uniref:TRM11 family SAM-dependent methyltransferase n=1 Tax=Nocardia coffeae TaxID=2873381 RepID=UPI001CA72A9D|nr:DNA methyltransferase [Nocardia coffeae]MBY8855358.1 site-specific DNA-methyltransferase [Nocardia coffeae]